jgi:ABC-type lipoprotein release transport system permease subunit
LIYDIPPDDPATLAYAALLLFVMATVSTWLPARRAAKIDPSVLLREN